MLKVVVKDGHGNEKLVCESIDQYHGSLVVCLLNQNFATQHREQEYKLVDMDYEIC